MALVIAGMLPGMLLHVTRKCVCFVFFNVHFLVGFGAVMMGSSFVMRCRGIPGGTLCLPCMSATLCLLGMSATVCSVGMIAFDGGVH
jgi:hypothetical protein